VVKKNVPPAITIALTRNDGEYSLIVQDNGVGLPPGFDITKTKTLGLKLVNFLAKHQMSAKIEVNSATGTEFIFRFGESLK
jgi:two-component sensor histidine kinase